MKNKGLLAVALLMLCVVIAVFPLIAVTDSEFGGADGQAEEVISALAPDYEPWAESLLQPPGGETESLLFALQAALGAGVLGLGFGYLIGRGKRPAQP